MHPAGISNDATGQNQFREGLLTGEKQGACDDEYEGKKDGGRLHPVPQRDAGLSGQDLTDSYPTTLPFSVTGVT